MDRSSFEYCSDFNSSDLEKLALARGITAIICCVISYGALLLLLGTILSATLGGCHCVVGQDQVPFWQNSIHQRLFLYLMISTVLYLTADSMHLQHYVGMKEDDFCVTIGYLDQCFGSVQFCFIFGIAVFLPLWSIARLHNVNCVLGNKKGRKFFEFTCVLVFFIIPFGVGAIPFAFTTYGEAGPWCWIKIFKENCSVSNGGRIEQLSLWYVPSVAITLAGGLSVIAMIVILVLSSCKLRRLQGVRRVLHHVQGRIAETVLLELSLSFYMIVWTFGLSGHVGSTGQFLKRDTYGYWLAYSGAIGPPLSAIAVPISFIVYFYYTAKRCCYTVRK